MDSYDVSYEVSYRGSYGEVNKVVGQEMVCEMISHCPGGNSSNKNAGNTLISRKQKRRTSK